MSEQLDVVIIKWLLEAKRSRDLAADYRREAAVADAEAGMLESLAEELKKIKP